MDRNRIKRGFTLVEVLVVVIIIVMLASFVAPKFLKKLGQAKNDIALSKMKIVEDALGQFAFDCGRMPTDEEGVEVLREEPADIEEGKWDGPYIKRSQLFDPWDNPYIYVEEGTVNEGSFDLLSMGENGVLDGYGEGSDDIYND